MEAMLSNIALLRDYLLTALKYVCAILISALVGIIFLQVLFRFVLEHPFAWAEEIGRFIFIWVSILGAVVGVETKAHFRIDIVPNRLSSRHKSILDLLLRGVIIIFALIFTFKGIDLTVISTSQFSPSLELPLSYIFVILPIGFTIICFFLLLSGLRTKNHST
jgi:TRAP-type C4-dicarboxylate transport system permease small subunit